jgi:phosphoserine phosphatase
MSTPIAIAVYDLDNTLVSGNTLSQFTHFYLRRESQKNLRSYLRYLFFLLTFFIYEKIVRKSKTSLLTRQLQGVSSGKIKLAAREYVETVLKFNPEITRRLEVNKAKGLIPVIISGSIIEIVSEVANLLSVHHFYASKLDYNDELATGEMLFDCSGKKDVFLKHLRETFVGLDLGQSVILTDNVSDIAFSLKFGRRAGVFYTVKMKARWSEVTEDLIDLTAYCELGAKHIYVPGFYYFTVRTNLITVLLYRLGFPAFVILSGGADFLLLVSCFLSWLIFICMYEIGYIHNDFFAVKWEHSPSVRIAKSQSLSGIWAFTSSRLFQGAIFCLLLSIVSGISVSIPVLTASLVTLFVFLGHNLLLRKRRVLSYLILKASHLYIPLIPLVDLAPLLKSIALFYLPYELLLYLNKIGIAPLEAVSKGSKILFFGYGTILAALWISDSEGVAYFEYGAYFFAAFCLIKLGQSVKSGRG